MNALTKIHATAALFGKVMAMTNPKHAVAYHFQNDADTLPGVMDAVQQVYDGPVDYAQDFMVWNVTKDDIRVRMAVVEEHTWAPPLAGTAQPPGGDPDREKYGKAMGVPVESLGYSDFIKEGRWDQVDEALRGVYKEASEALGQEFPYPEKQK